MWSEYGANLVGVVLSLLFHMNYGAPPLRNTTSTGFHVNIQRSLQITRTGMQINHPRRLMDRLLGSFRCA